MITISNLNFEYSSKQKVYSDFNLELEKGHIYGLLGKNGTGKSTLLSLLSGLLIPEKGKIDIEGKSPSDRKPSLISDIYLLTEEVDVFKYNYSMKSYAKLNAPFYPKFDQKQLEDLMQEFELPMDKKLRTLSTGQRKKAFIAFALACNTKVLLMDEPTNGLDIPSKSQFRKVLSAVSSDDRYIIISTHQVRDLEQLIDAVAIINEDKLLLSANIYNISKALSFGLIDNAEDAIYSQSTMVGAMGVEKNISGEPSAVDLELLFNATISKTQEITQILNQ